MDDGCVLNARRRRPSQVMAVGLGVVALAFGGLWWAEIMGRNRYGIGHQTPGDRHPGLPCAWSGRVGAVDPDVQWIECPGCGAAFAGDGDLTLPDHAGRADEAKHS